MGMLVGDRAGDAFDRLACSCKSAWPIAHTGALWQPPMHGARTTRTWPPSLAGNSCSKCSAPTIAHVGDSHTRTVTGGGGVSPSLTTSKCA